MVDIEKVNPEKEAFFEEFRHYGLSYGDIRLVPRPSEFDSTEVNIGGDFSRNHRLEVPIVSSPMDTVTGSELAIVMAKEGGLGVIHDGFTPDQQRKEVRRVKLHLNGMVEKPRTVREDRTLESVLNEAEERGWHFRTFPVVNSDKKFVGIITGRHFKYYPDNSKVTAEEVMIPASDVVTADSKTTVEDAYKIFGGLPGGMLPILNKKGQVKGLYLLSDVVRIHNEQALHSSLDENKRLLTAAAVPTDGEAIDRVKAMGRYLDIVVLDTATANIKYGKLTVKLLKEEFPNLDVIAGNISDGESAKMLVRAGADGLRIGQGPGAACKTIRETGVGLPQVSAIYETAKAIRGSGVPICADGGISDKKHVSIAIAAGADTVMIGSKFAATTESPGELQLINGQLHKPYRGMGSLAAMRDNAGARKRYQSKEGAPVLEEGEDGYVPHIGPAAKLLGEYVLGLRKSMAGVSAKNLQSHQENTELRFEAVGAGREGNPHDMIVK